MNKRFIVLALITAIVIVYTTFPAAFLASAQPAFIDLTTELNTNVVTREEFCVVLSKLFIKEYIGNSELPFKDIDLIKPENLVYIQLLYEKGVLKGSYDVEGNLSMFPDDIITKQEIFTLLGRVLGKTSEYILPFSDENKISSYAYKYIAWFAENHFMEANPGENFNPKEGLILDELIELMEKSYEFYQISDSAVTVKTLFGTGSRGFVDADPLKARFTQPYGVTCDKSGNVFVFDTYNNAIRKIDIKKNTLSTIAGKMVILDDNEFSRGYYLDGKLKDALMNRPVSGVFNSKGELIFADSENHTVRIIRANNVMYTYAGTTQGYLDGGRDEAKFNCPMAIAIDGTDHIYVADSLNNCVRKISPEGRVTTIAGIPKTEGCADGMADQSLFREPSGITVTSDGKIIYVADTGNHRIVKIENGKVTTIAGITDGNGDSLGGYKAGTVKNAMFNLPVGITLANGILIIADSGNNMIRAITPSGNVLKIAGNSEPGDRGGNPWEAMFNQPMGVYYNDGMIYIADTVNNKIKTMQFNVDLYQ